MMIDTILQGDVRSCLKQLEDESVQCCITSPPYWGLRDYGCDGQIGLEPTPEAYVADLVEVFREVKRVLRNDGVLWLNLGDSYANTSASGQNNFDTSTLSGGKGQRDPMNPGLHKQIPEGIKPKDLVGIPWRVAFALQADGWYLRSDIIWNKPNPMPESVTDRCTKSHEYIFMLTKSERYYYDAEAIKEAATSNINDARRGENSGTAIARCKMLGVSSEATHMGVSDDGNRNKRDVWTVATQPCSEAHFATFPPKLIEPMILAGTSEKGCCPKCGKPWERKVERTASDARQHPGYTAVCTGRNDGDRPGSYVNGEVRTLGWQPTCDCGLDPVPCTILDPFMGSGTTAIQAVRLHRHYLGCELNPEYVKMAERRIADMKGPLFEKEAA